MIDTLPRMSDRELADIGLSRALIHSMSDPEFMPAKSVPRLPQATRRGKYWPT